VALVDQTVTYLEMTSPDQLLAGRVPPTEVTLDSVDADRAGTLPGVRRRSGSETCP
jgi:hypothetical protein